MQIIPTILCGGAGSRLWPVSRELHPKPFIRLEDGNSFLQKAFLRAASLPDVVEILTVTNHELYFKTKDEYREVNNNKLLTSYILEPFGRNTAAAIAAAALYVRQHYDESAIMLILAADHLISDQTAFEQACQRAISLAAKQQLVTFGIEPHSAETGYGYIEANIQQVLGDNAGYSVTRFVEKPSQEKAQEYVESGRFLWNSGMFCFTAKSVLEQMQEHCPNILHAVSATLDAATCEVDGQGNKIRLDETLFAKVPDDSFDYAVMEPLSASQQSQTHLAVVPCNIGWSDIGSWSALGDLAPADARGNRISGHALLYDVDNCYVQSNERLVGAVGVENLIIIDTPDALLVADKSRAQDVKHVYGQLKAAGHDAHKLHRTVHRPWGTFTVLEEGERFKIKRIEVNPGARLSLQMHHHRNEHWIVVSGMARITNGESEVLLGTNQSTYIPAGNKHRLENPGVVNLVIIEVQSGEYLGEDDITRYEDNYGRVSV